MSLLHVLVETPLIWDGWYMLLIPCYMMLIFFPRSRITEVLFASGFIFLPAVIYLTLFAVVGAIASVFGFPFFSALMSTSGDFEHLQVASAFAVTATAADLAFASILLRKYADLGLLAKLAIGFWLLLVGWLLGITIYWALRRYCGVAPAAVRLGPFVVA